MGKESTEELSSRVLLGRIVVEVAIAMLDELSVLEVKTIAELETFAAAAVEENKTYGPAADTVYA